MLAVILKILSILGIILLIALGILLFLLLLVLFMPIVYRIRASKDAENLEATVKIRWLFGLVRAVYNYPEPGKIIAKVLWFTVYDSGKTVAKSEKKQTDEATGESTTAETEQSTWNDAGTQVVSENVQEAQKPEEVQENLQKAEPLQEAEGEADASGKMTFVEKLFAKYEKIKYTIRQICDKIKHIWENITFYKKLLQDEDTKLLISHAVKRIGKILRSIRPRKLKAQVLFGAASPDTTGYAYGLYGMLSPKLGKHVVVTPDFTQSILEGNVYAAGHLTVFTILRQALSLLFDKRLLLLKRRLDAHSKKMKQKT